MHDEFEMSMMGELNFFLGLQIKQMEDGIFFNQSNYIKEMLKKFGVEDSKPMKTPMSSDTKLTKDKESELVDSTKYRGMIGSTCPRFEEFDDWPSLQKIPELVDSESAGLEESGATRIFNGFESLLTSGGPPIYLGLSGDMVPPPADHNMEHLNKKN
nr:retrovirus-related Pol polyprotein from transposon TNT 1-94 [Tanacetum cinerariifolium]GFA52867.1 retrovirus-related Pol polyprotein from transposon TNT 1-94 [Tanacetum cinerariifolium]